MVESEHILLEALELSRSTNSLNFQPRLLLSLSQTSLEKHNLTQAKVYAEEALALTKPKKLAHDTNRILEQLRKIKAALAA